MGIIKDLRRLLEDPEPTPSIPDPRDDIPTPTEQLRPCVECGTLVPYVYACGICARRQPDAPLVHLCRYQTRPVCTEKHARAQHAAGFLAERDAQFRMQHTMGPAEDAPSPDAPPPGKDSPVKANTESDGEGSPLTGVVGGDAATD